MKTQLIVDLFTGKNSEFVEKNLIISTKERWKIEQKRWLKSLNIIKVFSGTKIVNGKDTGVECISFLVKEKFPRESISHPIPKNLKHSSFGSIQTDVLSALNFRNDRLIAPGHTCSKINDVRGTGTISFIGTDVSSHYGVSAGHVFTLNQNSNGLREVQCPGAAQNLAGVTSNNIGEVSNVQFQINDGFTVSDCAAFRIHDSKLHLINSSHLVFGKFKGIRSISSLRDYERVNFFSWRNNKVASGSIRNKPTTVYIDTMGYTIGGVLATYFYGPKLLLAGDSGAAVIDNQGYVIGIAVYASKTVAFILPIERVLNDLSISILL